MPVEALSVVVTNHSGSSSTQHQRGIPMVVSEVIAKGPPAPPARSVSVPLPNHFRYLHRAFVQPRHLPGIELTAFVKAPSRTWAIQRIAAVIAALEDGSTAESLSERIYNCASAIECVAQGLSEDRELRIFETGWGGGKAICFVEHPLFLVPDPAPLCRKWAQILQPIED
jgi:hypothetical protein